MHVYAYACVLRQTTCLVNVVAWYVQATCTLEVRVRGRGINCLIPLMQVVKIRHGRLTFATDIVTV
jgi:hypothetical protein